MLPPGFGVIGAGTKKGCLLKGRLGAEVIGLGFAYFRDVVLEGRGNIVRATRELAG